MAISRALIPRLTALLLLAVPRAGITQVSTRFDMQLGSRYVWRGISRAGPWVAQGSAAAGARLVQGVEVQAGAIGHLEIDRTSATELTEAGVGRHFGEADLWGTLILDPGPFRIEGSAVRYLFQGSSALRGIGKERNTTELRVSLAALQASFAPRFDAWVDVDKVKGVYLSASSSVAVLGWPFSNFIFAHLDFEAGVNLGQGPNPNAPGQLANFASRGFTHLSTGVNLSMRTWHWRGLGLGTVRGGFTTQVNFDDKTRARGIGKPQDFTLAVWVGSSLALGGDARRAR